MHSTLQLPLLVRFVWPMRASTVVQLVSPSISPVPRFLPYIVQAQEDNVAQRPKKH